MSEHDRALDPHDVVALADTLGRVGAKVAALVADATASSGLTPAEGAAMRAVAAAPDGLSQSSWGRRLGVSRQRAHALAEGLVARGLLAVSRAGRASIVTVTPAGSAAVAVQAAQVAGALGAALADVPDVPGLLGLLDGLAERLG